MKHLLWLFTLMLSSFFYCSAAAQEGTAQEFAPEVISENVDSLIRDSLLKEYILSHRSLVPEEINRFSLQQKEGLYGNWVSHYLDKAGMNRKFFSTTPDQPRKKKAGREWIFYSFAFLFLVLGLLNRLFNGYLKKLSRAYLNDGFVLKQTREQLIQLPQASLLFNLFFVLSASLFIYFGLGSNTVTGPERWSLIAWAVLFLIVIYTFKFLFLRFLGWVFSLKEAFENYIFIVFVNNKLMGILFLVSSFIMAFSDQRAVDTVFRLTLYATGIFILFRCFKGFRIFSRKADEGMLILLLAFISLELLPAALLIKFMVKEAAHFNLPWF